MNKWDIKYMLEGEQSKTDRLIDIVGKKDLLLIALMQRSRKTNKQ